MKVWSDDGGNHSNESEPQMNWTLEVVAVPVSDVERAKRFYAEQLGFAVDHDTLISGTDVRFVQLTPPRSGCSIVVGVPDLDMAPGSLQGLQLVVADLPAAHAQLVERGVEASEIQVFDGGSFRPSREGDDLDNVGFVYFNDPDGNGWGVQQISSRG
jgi:catechol 2,3-dioxygenase-like lactoylglutathione lyase family enzyme